MKVKKIEYIKGVRDIYINEDGSYILCDGKLYDPILINHKKQNDGFLQVSIKGVRFYVHHLIAEAFIPNTRPLINKIIIHKDSKTTNNHYSNLIRGTYKDLGEVLIKNEKIPSKQNLLCRGSSKISYEESLRVVERLKGGEYQKDIAKDYGVSEMSINRIKKRFSVETSNDSIRYPKKIKNQVMKLLEDHPSNIVSQITGIPYHTIWRWQNITNNKNE